MTLRNGHDASGYVGRETTLQAIPGASSVHLDRTRGAAHLGYDRSLVLQTDLEKRLEAADTPATDCPPSALQPGQPAAGTEITGSQEGLKARVPAP